MGMVREILVLAIVIAVFAACGSSSRRVERSPEVRRPEVHPVEDEGRKRPPKKGFVADAEAKILHRADCPLVKDIDPSNRVFSPTHWPALNEGCAPCERCEPLK